MSKRQIKRKMLSMVLSVVMLFSLLPTMQLSAATYNETIAEWVWDKYPEELKPGATMGANATGGTKKDKGANLDYSNKASNGSTTYTPSNNSIATNGWGGGEKYWLITIPKAGYGGLKLSFDTFGSGTGPKEFKVQVSIDNTTFEDVASGAYTNGDKHTEALTMENLSLPASIDTADTVYIKLLNTSTISIGGNSTAPGGTSRLYNIKVTGGTDTQGGGDSSTVEKVTATPGSGGVPVGTTVTLSTETPDATIHYTLNGGSVTTGSSIVLDESAFTGDPATATIQTYGKKDGLANSEHVIFTYTKAKADKVTTSLLPGSVNPGSKVELKTTTTGASIKYTMTKKVGAPDEVIDLEATYSGAITLTEDMLPTKIVAYATATNYQESEKMTFEYRLKAGGPEKNYFGQLHAHTAENSDGAGTLTEAYAWARDIAKLDFFAVTDHSNAFDTAPKTDKAGTYNLGAYNAGNAKWQNGLNAAAAAYTPEFMSLYGYEMTWSGGPGHMNTFNTQGFVSRNNTELNSKTNDAGLKAYYELLKQHPESISQFNHPGETFGTFSGFAYYDPIIDERISLIEVGNGEGAVGSGGYFPSYNEYNQALDKGWHLAPTNNQDNHKKGWGTSNTVRTVIRTSDFSMSGVYDALRDRQVYATEDNNLDIAYTLNGETLGTIIDTVPQSVDFKVIVNDPDETDKISTVSIISNGGRAVYSQNFNAQNANLDYTMADPKPGYYYIKVVEADGDIAVTAPVWLGKAPAVGITSVKSSTSMPVTTEELTLTTELFNNENTSATLKTITYAIKDGANIASLTPDASIESNKNYRHIQKFTPTTVGSSTIVVTAEVEINGEVKTFTSEIDLKVRDIDKLVFIGIDASHFNEYVSGNYKDSMGNFGKLAGEYNLRTVELKTSAELLAALENPKYKMMVFTAPSRRDGTTGRVPYATYNDAEIDAIAKFAQAGKTVVVAGWADYYESYANVKNDGLDLHMAGQQNKLLKAMGSTLRISDDGALDDTNNGGQAPRLYLTDYNNFVSPLTKGIVEGQVYSSYGGATIHAVNPDGTPALTLPTSVTPIISGHSTTYSKDQDGDGVGFVDKATTIPKYNDKMLLTASETLTHTGGVTSELIVAGAVFMSNFEIQAEVENAGSLNYSNYNILENIITSVNPVGITSIAEVKAAPAGTEFTIQGVATSGVYNGTEDNKGFFDCIYVQDTTGGINLFPVSQGVEVGQTVHVTGEVSAYQGETQLKVSKISVVDSSITPVTPMTLKTGKAMLPENTGRLIKTTGKVTNIVKDENGVVGQITINDGTGAAIAYINGYITKGKDLSFVKVGNWVTVTGLASVGENFQSETDFLPRIRIRDRGEIVKANDPNDNGSAGEDDSSTGNGSSSGSGSTSSGGSSSKDTIPTTEVSGEKAIEKLATKDKEVIKETVKEELPYTMGSGKLTVAQLDALTKGKFTDKQLEEIVNNPKLLEQLGIDFNNTTVVAFEKGEITEFKDVTPTHWAHESIKRLVEKGIVAGTPEGKFNPKESLQVTDTFTFLDRVLLINGITDMKLPRSTVEKYVTNKDNWAFAHVASVSSKLSEDTLKIVAALGNKPITRELLAQVLFEITDGKLDKVANAKTFKDAVASPYTQALDYCVQSGLLQGTSTNTMSPEKVVTRAELVTILERLDTCLAK